MEAAIKRARDGADQPFQPVGHADATEKHPVCMQAISAIGAGKIGGEIRKALRAYRPMGGRRTRSTRHWIALHRS